MFHGINSISKVFNSIATEKKYHDKAWQHISFMAQNKLDWVVIIVGGSKQGCVCVRKRQVNRLSQQENSSPNKRNKIRNKSEIIQKIPMCLLTRAYDFLRINAGRQLISICWISLHDNCYPECSKVSIEIDEK